MVDYPGRSGNCRLHIISVLFLYFIFLSQAGAAISVHASDSGVKVPLTEAERVWLAEHPVIRIGDSSEFEPELIVNPDGTFSGTLPDFIRLLEARLGVRFEIVDDKWPDLLRRAVKKEIDAVGLMNKDVAEKMGLLTIEAPYNVLVTAFARKERPFGMARDKDVEGLRVAYFREIVFLRQHFHTLQGKVEALPADSPLDALKLLLDKKADIMVGFNEDSYLLLKHSIREIEPIYTFKELNSNTGTAVRPDEPLLASILSKAYNSISHKERNEILSKWTWIPDRQEKAVLLSEDEKAWLAEHPVLKLGYDIDWPPIEQIDKNGRYVGLAPDFFSIMAQRLGIAIEPVAPTNWASMLSLAKKGELDLMSAVVQTPQRDEFLDFTNPYLTFPMVVVTREEVTYISDMSDLNGKRVGVVSGYATQDRLINNHPEIKVVPAKDVRVGLLDLVQGKTFAFIGNLATISRIIEREGLSEIKISGETPYKFNLCIGVRKGEAILVSIMQKALDSLSEEEGANIYNRWINVTYEYKINYRLLWQVLVVVAIVLAAIIYWNRRLAIEIKFRHQVEGELRKVNDASLNIMEDLQREIEERKKVEVELRKLTVVVEQNPVSIIITDLDGKIEYVNPQFTESTGYEVHEAIGQSPRILKSGHQSDEFYKILWETISAGKTWRGDFQNRKKNGEFFWESASISPVRDEAGKVINYVAIKVDITARKEAEESLKKSESSLAMAQTIANIGNWEWNMRSNELYWSDEIYRIFGLKPRQLNATYEAFINFVHPDDREKLEAAVKKALEGNARYSIDHRVILSDGTEKTVHEEGEVEFGSNNEPLNMMGTVHDITERKKIEEALHKAKEEAEEATKLKDKFVSLVSHDLKSPIQRIMGYLDLIIETNQVREMGKEMVSEALKGCEEMSVLIDEVLKVSRIKGGKITPHYSFVPVYIIAEQALKNYHPLALAKGITLINEIPETAKIYADERLLMEVLQNLLSNSIKFCKGGDEVRLFVPHGEPATIVVADTGVGISQENQKALFLYEEKTSTKGTAGEVGTGFGLPLCHDIVTAHKGRLELESETGKGSVFYVRLPDINP